MSRYYPCSNRLAGPLALTSALFLTTGLAQADLSHTTAELAGYVKLDTLISKYSEATPGTRIGKEFFVPGALNTSGQAEGYNFNMHARETRFFLKTHTPVNGHSVRSYIEIDFMVLEGGDERISNSYPARARHAYLTYDGLPGGGELLTGQTWSNFYNVASLPELNDFVGPVGTLFERQPIIRYTVGDLSVALENPETTVTVNGARVSPDDARLPDLSATYRLGPMTASVLLRELYYRDEPAGIDESKVGAAASVAGKIPLTEQGNDLRFMANIGNGLGRYMGLNAFHDAHLNANGELKTSLQWGAFVAYRHFWAPGLRSTVTGSLAGASYDADFPGRSDQPDRYYSSHVNLMYSPIKPLTYGIEYIFGKRDDVDGQDGIMHRVLISAKYDF